MVSKQRKSPFQRRTRSAASALLSDLCLAVGGKLGDQISGILESGNYKALLDLGLDPSEYTDSSRFRDDYLLTSLLSKSDFLDFGVDRDAVAIAKFRASEQQCAETNARLSNLSVYSSLRTHYTPLAIILMAQRKIRNLLGPFNWDQAASRFGFGPGSSTSLPRSRGDAYFKYGASNPHSTYGNLLPAWCAVMCVPRWAESLGFDPQTTYDPDLVSRVFKVVSGNKIVTVPKSAKTNRVIAIEPDMNMYIQLGLGRLIADRLRRVGIDLCDQSLNQSYAKRGSIDGSLATLDLSSASDTVSSELVRLLIPSDWLHALELARCSEGTLPSGERCIYQKWSSMGNGYTFALESLIFWGILAAVYSTFEVRGPLSVYGDDLIIVTEAVPMVKWMLEFCGFTVNSDKSFTSGPFRESCGKHYWKGADVTPIYVKKDIDSPDRLIWAANSIRKWAKLTYGLDGRFQKAYLNLVAALPRQLRQPLCPEEFGDISLNGDFDEVRPRRDPRNQAWVAKGWQYATLKVDKGGTPRLLKSLKALENRRDISHLLSGLFDPERDESVGFYPEVVLQPRVRRWRPVRVTTHQWSNSGPWLG